MNKYQEYQKALDNIKSIEVYPEENIYVSDYDEVDVLQELVDQTKTLTIEEVKKEWEEKGWEWSRTTTLIYIAHLTQKKSIGITSNNLVKINGWLDLQELELLTKTLKALEGKNESR